MIDISVSEMSCYTTDPDKPLGYKQSDVTLSDIHSIAKKRWFQASELVFLLNPEVTPLPITTHMLRQPPKSGAVLLFDRSATRHYRKDGHEWVKRRDSLKVREDYVKLRFNGRNRVGGFYAHSEEIKTLHRRSYHLLDLDSENTSCPSRKASTSQSLVLVHYFDTAGDIEQTVTPDYGLGTKRKRVISPEHCSSRIKIENRKESEVVYSNVLDSFASVHDDVKASSGWRNSMLQFPLLNLLDTAQFEHYLSHSQLRVMSHRRRESGRPGSYSDVPLSLELSHGIHDEFGSGKGTQETSEDLKISADQVEKVAHVYTGIGNNSRYYNTDRGEEGAPVSFGSFEADFDILWTYLCDEFGGSVSISLLLFVPDLSAIILREAVE